MIEPILNRWRGTGDIFNVFGFAITGVNIYAVYLGLLFGIVTSSWIVGILTVVGFRAGESFGWGKWVGALCYHPTEPNYDDLEGYNFPFIHKIANFIIKERKDFLNYCRLALGIRGLIWGLFIYLPLVSFQYISILDYALVSLLYGLGFPLCCELSRLKSFHYESKFISISGKWETQEVYYGIIHMIVNIYLVYTIIN